MHGWANHRVALDDLIAFVWSAPMRDLANKVGLSDVGLKKVLKSHGVVSPPQGYWNRVHAGRPVPVRPKAPARGPGEQPFVYVDSRFSILPQAPLPSSAGPFESPKVPEDLADLQAKEYSAIGRAVSAAKIVVPHPAVRLLLQRDEKERARAAASRWPTQPTLLFESPFEKRRLRILNAISATLVKRGHDASSFIDDYHVTFSVLIGDTRVSLHLDEAGRKETTYNRYNTPRPDPKKSGSIKLELRAGSALWSDDSSGTLETKVRDICAGLIKEGEREYREHLRRLEEEIERQAIEAEKRRQERLKRANADRLAALMESGRLLSEATHLRSLIASVSSAVAAGQLNMSDVELTNWRDWANGQADAIDPVRSGQVLAHLSPPKIE